MTTQIKREPDGRSTPAPAGSSASGAGVVASASAPLYNHVRREDDAAEFDMSQHNNKIWLVKLPKFLYDKWTQAEPGSELGQMRINETNKREMRIVTAITQSQPQRRAQQQQQQQREQQQRERPEQQQQDSMQVDRDEQGEGRADGEEGDDGDLGIGGPMVEQEEEEEEEPIPEEYALAMQNQVVNNTYVFSEPPPVAQTGQAASASLKVEEEDLRLDSDDEQPVVERRPAGGPDRTRRNQGGQKLRGKVVHECLVKPIDDARYRSLLKARSLASEKPRRQIQQIDDMSGNFLQPGIIGPAQGSTGRFMAGPSKRRNREIHARLPIDALMDSIFKCFEEYEFWSLKAFKHQLKQPESYLKEVLEGIATLHKRGPHTGKWQLKAETKGAISGLADVRQGETAPDEQLESSDEDIEMEDRL